MTRRELLTRKCCVNFGSVTRANLHIASGHLRQRWDIAVPFNGFYTQGPCNRPVEVTSAVECMAPRKVDRRRRHWEASRNTRGYIKYRVTVASASRSMYTPTCSREIIDCKVTAWTTVRLENNSTRLAAKYRTASQPHPYQERQENLICEPAETTSNIRCGGVTERPNVPVLKTGDLVRGPRVQISPPPPYFPSM